MTDESTGVIDADTTTTTTTEQDEQDETRTFRVVSHKAGLIKFFEPFGGQSDIGVSVDADKASTDLWWMPTDWAIQVLNAGIELPQLTAPTPGWLASLPEQWRSREVGTLLKRDIPRFFEQHPEYQQNHPQVVVSVPAEHTELMPPRVVETAALAQGDIPGFDSLPPDCLLQLDEMMPCVVEVRCWVAEGVVTTAAPYRIGMIGWDSALFLEMLFNTEGMELQKNAVEFAQRMAAEVDGPPGYAVDIGVTIDGTCTVLRGWPAWAVEPLSADPAGVFQALLASHDHRAESWRWNPDRRVYDRPEIEQPEPEYSPPTPEEFFADQEEPTDD